MNVMNINERVLGTGDSLCFVANKLVVSGLEQAHLACFYITNAFATPKKWFIKVHLVHRRSFSGRLSYKLMNLMNFNELACYLRLFFAMYLKRDDADRLIFSSASSSSFIRFIKNGGLA